jgi:putative transposase
MTIRRESLSTGRDVRRFDAVIWMRFTTTSNDCEISMYDPERYHRCSIQLQEYDHTASTAYFITVVTYARMPHLAHYQNGALNVSVIGQIAIECWRDLPRQYPTVALDTYSIMPDYIQGVIVLTNATNVVTLYGGSQPARSILSSPIGAIVGSYKMSVLKQARLFNGTLRMPFWQRNYYEHLIRSGDNLSHIRQSIYATPNEGSIAPLDTCNDLTRTETGDLS